MNASGEQPAAGGDLPWRDPRGDPNPVIDPVARMRKLAGSAGVDADPPFPPLALCAFMQSTVDHLREATDAQPCVWHARSAIGHLSERPVVVTKLGPGAPQAVLTCEELIGAGVRTLLVGGATGSLQPRVAIGDYVAPTGAIREEGTSLHYVAADHQPSAEGPAVQALIAAAEAGARAVFAGQVWTTDAPYREFAGKVHRYGADGVLGVDMEASALLTLAEFRGVDLGMLLTVSDHVFDSAWPNIFGTAEYRENCLQLAGLMLDAARSLLTT